MKKAYLLLPLALLSCNPLSSLKQTKFGPDFLPGVDGDYTGPSLTYSPSLAHRQSMPAMVTVSFSEPVFDLTLGDFTLSGACAATLAALTHSPGSATATLTLGGNLARFGDECSLQLTGSVRDAHGNLNQADPGITYRADTVNDAGFQINAYAAVTDAALAPGDLVLELDDASDFSPGDQILLIQMQHNANPAAAGTHEFATIAAKAGNQLTLTAGLNNAYSSGTFNSPAAQVTQAVRAPSLGRLHVSAGASVTAPPWNGSTGGVIVADSTGLITVAGSISATGLGFRGGQATGVQACAAMPLVSATQGESEGGMGNQSSSANGSGGGAGNSGVCGHGNLFGAAGGGGGGYGGNGEDRSAFDDGPQVVQGAPGGSTGLANLSRLLAGGGGGAGGAHDVGTSGSGGAGGGIVILQAHSVTVTGSISANGGAGADCVSFGGSGGGGAGGSILISALDSATLGNHLVTATGGAGGQVTGNQTSADYRQGGSGGEGRVKVNGVTVGGSTLPAYN